jgi:hypothetical protein
MEVKRLQHRTRTRSVEAGSPQHLEDTLNTMLEELESAGQGILSVQIFPAGPSGPGAGAFTAFILYTDNVGLDEDFTQRYSDRDQERDRKTEALHQRVAERRAQKETDAIVPDSEAVSTPGS